MSRCGQAWGGAEALLGLGRPAGPWLLTCLLPHTLPCGWTWHSLGASRAAAAEASERKVDETQMKARSPLLGHCRPARPSPGLPHASFPAPRGPPSQPSQPHFTTRAAATTSDLGVTRAGRGWGKGKGGNSSMKIRMLFSICKEGKVLPPTCSLLLLPSARHSWTITYRFPTSAANTWERISAPGAPPSLGGALPRFLTAEAGPFRAVIGAAGKGGRAPERNLRLSLGRWNATLTPDQGSLRTEVAAKPNCKGSLQSLAPNPAATGSRSPKRKETGLMTCHLRPQEGGQGQA